jgi:NTE family protein
MSGPTRFGVVFGAGGHAGAAFHRGVVAAMRAAGLDPREADVLVGTSAGAVVAATLRERSAARPAPRTRQPDWAFLPRRGAMVELVRRPREGVNALLLRPEFRVGRLDLAQVLDDVRIGHGPAWPLAPLWVVAVRRADGRRVVFGRPGAPEVDVASAVAASCAVPGYVPPVEIDGVAYVDGGVHSPTNADLLADCDLDLVVVSSPMSADLHATGLRIDLPVRLRFHRFLRTEVWALRRRGLRVVTIEPDRPTLQAMGLRMLRARNADGIEHSAHAQAQRLLAHPSTADIDDPPGETG